MVPISSLIFSMTLSPPLPLPVSPLAIPSRKSMPKFTNLGIFSSSTVMMLSITPITAGLSDSQAPFQSPSDAALIASMAG